MTLPAAIQAMIDAAPAGSLTIARCVKVTLRDGSEYGFTDHDRDLEIALPSDQYGAVHYQAGNALIVGDIDLALGLSADSTEIAFPFGGLVELREVVGRRLNHATVEIFDVDWSDPLDPYGGEPFEVMKGRINDARAEGPMAICEVRSQADYWNQVIGELMSPRCAADFGDERCKATVERIECTVTSVISTQQFSISLAGGYADNYFKYGTLQFLGGGLQDVWIEEVFGYTGASGLVELTTCLPDAPEVGDPLWIAQGCSRIKVLPDDPSIPTCATHENVVNFRGYDRVPGSDTYLRMPIPGQGNDS